MVSQATVDSTPPVTIDHRASLTIGQVTAAVTQITGIRCTSAMIYYYERMGVLEDLERTESGYRLFDLKDVQRVACIKRWQQEGLTLEQIAARLESDGMAYEPVGISLVLPEDRRSQILNAAMQTFPQKGYDATTLLDIAEQADVSSATIYQYFRGKEELFMAIIDDLSFRDFLRKITDLLQGAEMKTVEDIYDTLVGVGKLVFEANSENPHIHRMFLAESRNFPEIGRQYFLRLIAPMEGLLEQFIFDPLRNDILRNVDPKVAARAFYGMLINFLVTQLLNRDGNVPFTTEQQLIEQLVDIYLAGVLR